jgi:hypothetical protein
METRMTVLLAALGLVGLAAIAVVLAAKRNEDAQESQAALRARLVAIARQRNDYFND